MKQQLLVETLDPVYSNLIQESQDNGKTLYLNGIISQADVKNRNNRIYPLNELSKASQNLQKMIEDNNNFNAAFGEFKKYDSKNGKVLKSLISRRYQEAELFYN